MSLSILAVYFTLFLVKNCRFFFNKKKTFRIYKSGGVFGCSRSSILKDECTLNLRAADESYYPETTLSHSMVKMIKLQKRFNQEKYCRSSFPKTGRFDNIDSAVIISRVKGRTK